LFAELNQAVNERTVFLLGFERSQLALNRVPHRTFEQLVITQIWERTRDRQESCVPQTPGRIFRPAHRAAWRWACLRSHFESPLQGIE
jgi:hypothetical protein